MGNRLSAHHYREDILGRVKIQYEPGPMRHRLYEIFEIAGYKPPTPSYEWMYNAGMGNVDFIKSKPAEKNAIEELLKEGRLVPTFEDDFYGIKKIRRILHFDDVKFGIDANNDIVIYDLVTRLGQPDFPDLYIKTNEMHAPAVAQIKARMDFTVASHAVTIDDAPIRLKDGPVIRPLITNADQIELRQRQKDFQP